MEFETSVDQIIKRTHDVKSFRFKKPAGFDYDPGQFFFVTILIGGEKSTKHFTISSSPTEKEFIEFTKKITEHEFSAALDKLKIGDWVYVDGPYGDFSFKGEYPGIGMISGGIGITPLRSMIRYCTDKQLNADIILLYSNRSEDDIVFKDELDWMQRQNNKLKVVHTVTRPGEKWNGYTGRVNKEMIQKEIPDYMDRVFYSCGPPKMVDSMVSILTEMNIPDKQIKQEYFPGY